MSNVNYDQAVIQTFANAMYAKAHRIVVTETIKYGFFIGFAVMIASIFILGRFGVEISGGNAGLTFILGATIGGYVGWQNGQLKAFHLKLEAQRALCFAQIEQNSRTSQLFTKVA